MDKVSTKTINDDLDRLAADAQAAAQGYDVIERDPDDAGLEPFPPAPVRRALYARREPVVSYTPGSNVELWLFLATFAAAFTGLGLAIGRMVWGGQ